MFAIEKKAVTYCGQTTVILIICPISKQHKWKSCALAWLVISFRTVKTRTMPQIH